MEEADMMRYFYALFGSSVAILGGVTAFLVRKAYKAEKDKPSLDNNL